MNEQNPNENPDEREAPSVDSERRDGPEAEAGGEQGLAAEPSGAADAPTEPGEELPTISEEELNSLLAEAMDASAATDSGASNSAEQDAPGPDAPGQPAANPYLEDLQRVQAEYANYRRRTDREKEELAEATTAKVVAQLLPVLDDLDRADAAGDLPEGSPLQVIASKLRATFERLGVERYGAKGEKFDPRMHEAIAQLPNPEVTEATIADVVEIGYRIGEREIRAPKVAVFVPAE